MPRCIKCDWEANRDEGFGNCPHCGMNRGWKRTKIDGRVGFCCRGCETGDVVFPCPNCGHHIIGKNDLFYQPPLPSLIQAKQILNEKPIPRDVAVPILIVVIAAFVAWILIQLINEGLL